MPKNSGYPTPEEQTGDVTYGCIPVFVPNNPEFQSLFAAAIYGLYAQMSKEYFWREQGTLSPELAAFYAASGLAQTEAYAECGGVVSCDDIADCIETDEIVQSALAQNLANNGFSPGGNAEQNSQNVTMSPSQSAANLLPEDYDCSDNQLMATARAIVQKFDEFTQDFFDQMELLTNPLELVDITSDGIPVADTLGNVAAFADFVAQTVRETYQASYNNASEQEIADIRERTGIVCVQLHGQEPPSLALRIRAIIVPNAIR